MLFCYHEDTGALVRHVGGASARHGTPTFHRWNERNQLLVLLRCAPAGVATRELARFAVLTLVLPFHRHRLPTPNFVLALRLRVLAEVATHPHRPPPHHPTRDGSSRRRLVRCAFSGLSGAIAGAETPLSPLNEHVPSLKTSNHIVIADIYDPMHLEQLEQGRDLGDDQRAQVVDAVTAVLSTQLRRGDFFLCSWFDLLTLLHAVHALRARLPGRRAPGVSRDAPPEPRGA